MLEFLLDLLDRAYDRQSWHGPNLKGTLRRVSAAQAGWRPGPGRHSIAEIAVHAAYWKYASRRRLTGGKRGSFTLKGSNWFKLPDPLDEPTWRGYLKLLDDENRGLRDAVAGLTPKQLDTVPRGSKISNAMLIQAMAAHDLYHAGQIQLLKKLAGGPDDGE